MTTHPPVETSDGIRLHVTDTGDGEPVLFLHEYAGDHRSWSRQVAELREDFRCVTYAARGYTPSDVPTRPSAYSWQRAVEDALNVLDALELQTVHIVGLSMGGYTALQLGLRHPDRVRSVMAVSAGSGSDPAGRPAYLEEARIVAKQLRFHGSAPVGRAMGEGPSRVQLKHRDEQAWHEMIEQFSEQSAEGRALTILQIQACRPSLHDMIDDFRSFSVPLLVVNGDEDEACLSTGIMLKRTVPSCGMHILPNSGHVPNLEDPRQFNGIIRRFIHTVESDTWPVRDPRSRLTSQFGLDQDAPADPAENSPRSTAGSEKATALK
ncbi:alpha/beta fold hydrolase [Rhodococcus opacus]|uniref:alpha/beta fold hydrolase n=1 Tax=Rhodococcus opacus TaxID=37919 RepID=UPI00042EBC34|nr:alpha/beta hydrolase [Rhodococcus opacus]AHK35804.1 3-oxoadipate enol-lactonase 1 [Rhodococcus opacus PD630]KXX59630.1 alpha/beta hydrolase [Rhodococcus sp. LB1]UDH01425.1 alpha/beta hydrolase [Rhodococcus opacus PD630]